MPNIYSAHALQNMQLVEVPAIMRSVIGIMQMQSCLQVQLYSEKVMLNAQKCAGAC